MIERWTSAQWWEQFPHMVLSSQWIIWVPNYCWALLLTIIVDDKPARLNRIQPTIVSQFMTVEEVLIIIFTVIFEQLQSHSIHFNEAQMGQNEIIAAKNGSKWWHNQRQWGNKYGWPVGSRNRAPNLMGNHFTVSTPDVRATKRSDTLGNFKRVHGGEDWKFSQRCSFNLHTNVLKFLLGMKHEFNSALYGSFPFVQQFERCLCVGFHILTDCPWQNPWKPCDLPLVLPRFQLNISGHSSGDAETILWGGY